MNIEEIKELGYAPSSFKAGAEWARGRAEKFLGERLKCSPQARENILKQLKEYIYEKV